MRKHVILLSLSLCLTFCVVSAWAGPRDLDTPRRYQPRAQDQGLVTTINPADGTQWAAWAYRNGAEYEIAVARTGENRTWNDPVFFGFDDGTDQLQPSLTADDRGTVYLAFHDVATGRVMLTWLATGSTSWNEPQGLTAPGLRAESPIARVVSGRLVVAYRVGDDVRMLDMAPPRTNEDASSLIIDSGDPVGATDEDPDERGGDGSNESSSSDSPGQRGGSGSMEANGSTGRNRD